jgi:CIC family chloride channel protein
VLVLDESTLFITFLSMAAAQGGLRHVVVTRAGKIIGGVRVNVGIRRAVGGSDEVRLGDLVGQNFIVVAEDDVAFDVIKAITQARAAIAIVVARTAEEEPDKVVGVITKEHIADTVSRSVELYPG